MDRFTAAVSLYHTANLRAKRQREAAKETEIEAAIEREK